jgi:molybdopterin/thiamine biosynthesis adenylyltransferase
MGLLQANEVIKLIVGIGEPMVGRLLMFEALTTTFIELKLRRDPDCPVCGRLYSAGDTPRLVASRS